MKRLLPHPVVSLGLCALWLLLNQSLSPGNLLLGVLLGIAVPLLSRRLVPLGYPRMRAPAAMLRLLVMATVEIVRSCFNVSRIILLGSKQKANAQFIRVPLTIRDPYGLAMLSCLITMTPGTVWVEILPEHYELSMHVLDLHDAQWWINTIKNRYERPLITIFEPEDDHGHPA